MEASEEFLPIVWSEPMFSKILFEIIEWVIRGISGGLGQRVRRAYYARRLCYCGSGVKIGIGVQFIGVEHITLEDDVWIDDYVILIAGSPSSFGNSKVIFNDNPQFKGSKGSLTIGPYVHIAPFCLVNVFGAGGVIGAHSGMSSGAKIYATSNHYVDKKNPSQILSNNPKSKSFPAILFISPVILGENCFVSLNSIILSCSVGKYSFIRPNSVVAKNIPINSVVSGNPGKVLGKRFEDVQE